ncbi:PfkB family carbohydrate kinase [Clostridium estertheticum]|uniref:PfkB family carbohydrate kinase n=1 Tax=Clostridium estertheticum TaxID=238834 RepID=UPI001CF47298|nr:PfkB family carbohydrate kinase [Clostridium estertheticum]MCB2361348.1 PfkB family carbohydrate kinase [Clostridium estertheticum]
MDVVTFGESMVLFGPDSFGPLRYVQNFNKSIAGAESNVSIALAKLGHRVGWFSKLGDDEFGRYIQSTIRGEGVDVSRGMLLCRY